MKGLQISIILLLVLLSVQGWTGDYVNLFAVFPSGPVKTTVGGLVAALESAGIAEVFHASLAFAILAVSILDVLLSLMHKAKSLRVASILGLAAVVSALVGGLLFVFSGFTNNGNSAQMGGSFIGAYAFYFLELYYTKGQAGLKASSGAAAAV